MLRTLQNFFQPKLTDDRVTVSLNIAPEHEMMDYLSEGFGFDLPLRYKASVRICVNGEERTNTTLSNQYEVRNLCHLLKQIIRNNIDNHNSDLLSVKLDFDYCLSSNQHKTQRGAQLHPMNAKRALKRVDQLLDKMAKPKKGEKKTLSVTLSCPLSRLRALEYRRELRHDAFLQHQRQRTAELTQRLIQQTKEIQRTTKAQP